MKKIIFILIILLTITGCNSYIELNDLDIINQIGIKHLDNYILYASIINNNETKIIKIEGNNIYNLIDNLTTSLNKKIYLSHLDLLIIDDSIKKYELNELINFFKNNNETREDFLVINTNNIEELINNSKFQEINKLIKINQSESSKSIYTTMYDIMSNYYLNKPIYLSNIEYNNNIIINGLKEINNNKISYFNNEDSLYINYLLNNIYSYKLYLKSNNNNLYINILSSNTKYLNNKIYIFNEIKVINNDYLSKHEINNIFNTYLINNISKYTNKKIIINNNIRSIYENN